MRGPSKDTAGASGAAAFDELNRLLQDTQRARFWVGAARRRARQVLPQTGRLLWYVRHLPVLRVEVSDSHAGRAIGSALSHRRGIVPATTAAAVLELPDRPEAYLVGRSRQAVRTGINHARRQGLQVVRVRDDAERGARALEMVGKVNDPGFDAQLTAWSANPHGESWFVVDASATTVALAVVNVDGPIGRLDTVISARGAQQSPARNLLSAQVFMDLIAEGVSHVLSENSLFLPPGLLQFQRLLGFQLMNIELHTRTAGDPDPRATGPLEGGAASVSSGASVTRPRAAGRQSGAPRLVGHVVRGARAAAGRGGARRAAGGARRRRRDPAR